MLIGHVLYIIALNMMCIPAVASAQCKWSNENCATYGECCSQRCVKLHEGTNARCASSSMHFPCFFGYQCEKGLACGDMYSCCAPFWGVCVKDTECCEKDHFCREVDGFTYNRCLPNSSDDNLLHGQTILLTTIASYISANGLL